MRPEGSIRDLSILVSTPTVIVAIITGVLLDGLLSRGVGGRTEPDDHCSLDVVCDEGDFESAQSLG